MNFPVLRVTVNINRAPHHLANVIKGKLVVSKRMLQRRSWSGSSTTERLRIAIVGGGVAGLSVAIHLSRLVRKGVIEPVDIFDNHSPNDDKREIGVGIWSTGLDPFRLEKDEESHQLVWNTMTKMGSWVGNVGYRTPSGHWLARSHLPTDQDEDSTQTSLPRLLFLRECDMLETLQQAIRLQENQGTVRLHQDGSATRVVGIHEETHAWSARLVVGESGTVTDRDYHLIVAADGMNSNLRKTYGGFSTTSPSIIGTAVLEGGNAQDLIHNRKVNRLNDSWEDLGQAEATSVQDRHYTVFRGNAPLTNDETGADGVSFQTWGHGRSMRFATVPMSVPADVSSKVEQQVWFVTINDDAISTITSPIERRHRLLDTFSTWHDPICRIIQATPPETILMERALAHKHSIGPILNFNKVVGQIHREHQQQSTSHVGPGPAIVFLGDAHMTVDPILAQGFTMAMEGAAALPQCIEQCCIPFDTSLAFDPVLLRKELHDRHHVRTGRLVKLLRATELVQALSQPSSGTLAGFASRFVVRPLMQVSPNVVKTPVFNAMLKYSLGR